MTKRVAVVTGSTQGWGRAVAESLAQSGIAVIVNGRNRDVDEVVRSIRARGGEARGVQLASDTAEGVEALMAAALDAFGHVDIWVNSLGVQRPEPLLTLSLDAWDEVLRIQLTAVFLGTQCAARQMIKQGNGGRIINVVGGGAYGLGGASAHSASKGGALSATYSWADELRPYGITVNAIRGAVQSPNMRKIMLAVGFLDAKTDAESNDPLRGLGFHDRDVVAALPAWLASEEAGDVTGFHIGIDGRRITVYDRVKVALEMYEDEVWTVGNLAERLHGALRELPQSADGWAQRDQAGAAEF